MPSALAKARRQLAQNGRRLAAGPVFYATAYPALRRALASARRGAAQPTKKRSGRHGRW